MQGRRAEKTWLYSAFHTSAFKQIPVEFQRSDCALLGEKCLSQSFPCWDTVCTAKQLGGILQSPWFGGEIQCFQPFFQTRRCLFLTARLLSDPVPSPALLPGPVHSTPLWSGVAADSQLSLSLTEKVSGQKPASLSLDAFLHFPARLVSQITMGGEWPSSKARNGFWQMLVTGISSLPPCYSGAVLFDLLSVKDKF